MKAFASALLVCVAACGQGKAIFNVDVYSFMAGTGKDTIQYAVPPALSESASTVLKVSLPPGFGSSSVDSVKITTGSADLMNTAGSGSIGFSLFFASDSASTWTAPAALNIPATAVNGVETVPVSITGDLSGVVDSLFKQNVLWVRVQAKGTNGGATLVQGKGVLTALLIRVVLQDKVF
jgi:hypothetical protein